MSEDDRLRALQRQIAQLSADLNRIAGETPVILFKDYAAQYLEAKLARPTLRQSTKVSFENQVRKHLIPRFGLLPLEKISNIIWLQWVEDEKGMTKFFNARKCLVEILRAAKEDGKLAKVPVLDNPDEYEPVGRVVEDAEALQLLWKSSRPFRFIFYTMWRMGNRPREILRWEWDMVHFNEPGKTWIKIPARISKTKRNREIAVDPAVSRILYRRHRRGPGGRFVFPARQDYCRPQLSYHSAFTTACRRAQIAEIMPYDFRRTRITKWAAAGKSLAFVARQLDTSETMIRRIYLKDDAEAMEGLFK